MIRVIRAADVPAAVALVHELADYERAAADCTLTVEQLHTALFSPAPALFGHVAEIDAQVVGVALWFLNFSTWEGSHGIYLEDLIVAQSARGHGAGRALLGALAQVCIERSYARLEWTVLDWNAPALGFYASIGAQGMHDWTAHRLSGPALRALADTATAPGR